MSEVFVDIHEPDENVETLLYLTSTDIKNRFPFQILKKDLKIADYVFKNALAMERKTVQDCLHSIFQGRAQEQALNMSQNYTLNIWCVSGDLSILKEKDQKAIMTFLANLQIRYKFITMILPDDTLMMYYFLIMCYNLEHDLIPNYQVHRHDLTNDEEQVGMLMGIMNIGIELARNLLTHFGTLEKIVQASQKELEKVEKIGKKKSNHIQEIFRKKYLPCVACEFFDGEMCTLTEKETSPNKTCKEWQMTYDEEYPQGLPV